MTDKIKDPAQALYAAMEEHGLDVARAHKRPVQRFRASEASSCVRQIWHRLNGDRPAPRTSDNLIYGVCGDIDHDATRQIMENFGIEVGGVIHNKDGSVEETMFFTEKFVVDTPTGPVEIVLSGRADGEIMTPLGRALLEIKGQGFYAFDWIQKAFVAGFRSGEHGQMPGGHGALLQRIKEKKRDHYWQCQVAMKLTKHERAYLLYKDRSTGQLGIHNPETGERTGVYIEFEPEVFEEILQRFAFVKCKLLEGKPPAPEHSAKSKDCSYCDFYYLCHGAQERREAKKKPAILYPGPQMEIHLEDREEGDHDPEPDA